MDRYIKFESWYRLWGMDFNILTDAILKGRKLIRARSEI